AICSGVWSHPVGLVIEETPYRDGREWTRQVRPVRNDEKAAMVGIDIGTLLRKSGFDRIFILKVDIERAESVVFSSNYEQWINSVDNIVIELHDEECRAVFMKAIASADFAISQCDELTVCKRTFR
ncbi:MAG TPA: hypothetical protein VMX74_15645, partial [Pirellulales bacterium]|nr:hypothetical protein [Pirellulales bacterium]